MAITGQFKIFSLFVLIILFHELGHILSGLYFNWNIEKVLLLPFGGITIFNNNINHSLKEEFIICLCGPLFQITFYLLVKNYLEISDIHYNLLIFNLLPIVPLDGSKLLSVILNKFFSFKTSLYLTDFISIITIFLLIYLLITNKNLLLYLVIIFLVFKVISEIKNVRYVFNRFLLERYYNPVKYKKTKLIKGYNLTQMFLEYNHLFYINKKYHTEREIIKKRFDLQRKM